MIQKKQIMNDKPSQLWADLQCPKLWAGLIQDPIKIAAEEARRLTRQQGCGIIPLKELRLIV